MYRDRLIACSLWISILGAWSANAANVTTWRYDATRQGQITTETQLTPSNVNQTSFGKLYSYPVDGYVYAQPLYVGGLNIGGAVHNVLFIATEHDSVYAYDADQNQQLWKASLLDGAHGAAAGATSVPSGDLSTNDIVPEVGITGTPVIDPTSNSLFVVSKTKENGVYVHRLHALDLLTGSEKLGGPTVITGSVPGAGIGSVGGKIAFDPQWELNRTGLLLYNGQVYVPYAAHGDNGPYHGWILSYSAATLKQTGLLNTSPGGRGNGVWHSGAAPAADTVNGVPRMFFATGNFISTGALGPNPTPPYTSTQDYSNAVVHVDLSNGAMQIADSWTPFDQAKLSSSDLDQSSGGILLLPDQTGPVVHELIQAGKNGRIEVLDRDNLGGFNASYNNVVQEISGQIGGLWSTPAYWNNNVYIWSSGGPLKQFPLTAGKLSTTAKSAGSIQSAFPGASPVISSSGTTGGIVWAVRSDAYNVGGAALLYAYDATNVATPLYISSQNSARDAAGRAVKFVVPVVNQGKVYVGTQGEVDVYGLLASSTPKAPTPVLSPAPGTYAAATNVSITDSLSGAILYYTTDGTTPYTGSPRYTAPFTISSTSTVQAFAAATGYNDSNVVSGAYTIGSAPSLNFSNGFASVAGLTLNGTAANSDDSRLQLTTGAKNQAGSAFSNSAFNIQNFTTDFTIQLSGTAPLADGITFTIQANAPTALGPSGGGLGYGPAAPNGTGGIPHSVAVKFDVFSNAGEGNDSTGLYVNGASPTTPSVNLSSTGVVFSSGDTIKVHMEYDGKSLYLTLQDPVTGGAYSGSFPVNIPSTIGSNTAYVGFTGGTGGYVSSQKILTWTFTSQTPTVSSVQYQTESLPAVSSGPTFRTIAWNGFPDGKGTILDSTKVGDSVAFTVNIANAGTYDLHVTTKNFNARGIWQLSVDGTNVGAPEDEYAPTETAGNFDLGNVVFGKAGSHTLKFTVTGRNAAANDWKMAFDVLRFDQQ